MGTGIGEKSWQNFLAWREQTGEPLLEAVFNPPPKTSPKARVSFARIGECFRELGELAKTATPGELAAAVIDRIEYRNYLLTTYPEPAERLLNVDNLIMEAGEYPDLETFLVDLALSSSSDEVAGQAVSLMTIHSAKGLEFDNVFVVGLEEGLLPMTRDGSKSAIEEERRLLYVAMTRARKRLFISMAHRRQLYGKTEYQAASRFLADLVPGLGAPAEEQEYRYD